VIPPCRSHHNFFIVIPEMLDNNIHKKNVRCRRGKESSGTIDCFIDCPKADWTVVTAHRVPQTLKADDALRFVLRAAPRTIQGSGAPPCESKYCMCLSSEQHTWLRLSRQRCNALDCEAIAHSRPVNLHALSILQRPTSCVCLARPWPMP
jgi:hypothetical protein